MSNTTDMHELYSPCNDIKYQMREAPRTSKVKYSKEERVDYWITALLSVFVLSPISYKKVASRADSAFLQCICFSILSNMVFTYFSLYSSLAHLWGEIEEADLTDMKILHDLLMYIFRVLCGVCNRSITQFIKEHLQLIIGCFIVHRLLAIEVRPGHLLLYSTPLSLIPIVQITCRYFEFMSILLRILYPCAGLVYLFSSYSARLKWEYVETKICMGVTIYILYFILIFTYC